MDVENTSMNSELRSVFIYGRFKDLSREQITRILVNRGERLVRSALRADTVVVAHSALKRCVMGSSLELPFEKAPSAALISEGNFRRVLTSNRAEHSLGPLFHRRCGSPFPNG